MSFDILDNLSIKLIDGDRGKNYPKQSDFFDKSDCLFLSAKNVTKDGFEFTDCSFISKEKDQQLRAGKLERNDIVLTTRGTIGNSALYDSSVSISSVRINSGMIILRPDTNIWNPRFLYFLLNSDFVLQQISALTSGSAVPQLPARDLKKFILPRVSLDKQHEIVEIIGSIVDKIRVSKAINQTLEQMAQALFKSWFVDFEPVKAKIAVLEAGGSQEDATLAAMTAISGKDADALAVFEREYPAQYAELNATAELFPSAMQDNELGEIPVGWKLQPFGELLSHTIGGDWGKDEPDDKHKIPVRIIRGTDIPNIKSCQDGNVPFRYVEEKKLKARSLNAGDIVIEVSGGSPTQPTGRSIYITDDILKRLSLPVEPASFCRLFRPKSMELGMILGLHLEKIYQDGKTWLYQNQSTGISNFQTKVFLENEMVSVAPSEILKSFYKTTLPFVKLMHSSENIKLTQLRDTLLPKLLSGEITLPEAEQTVSEAENV
ncbi:TPA: restriction endonuclease subunit S [Citrobacter amalonaticus]|nr:restriction endonuclease subunit S [Citrobacter amalonaticus]